MNKLFILFVTISGLLLMLSSGCENTKSDNEGWLELKPAEVDDKDLINPDDYK